ncbi:MAG: response regulator [Pseudomonadota bacterium]
MTETVLIVEDEPKLATLLGEYLEQAGFNCHVESSGASVSNWIEQQQPAIVLLDVMLPDKDGFTVLREIRQTPGSTAFGTPVIMLTARVEEIDRLLGLELGADDYICKPFSPREVVARVKAVLRRSGPSQQVRGDSLELDADRNRISYKGQSLSLTAVEFRLLERLVSEPGRIFSRDQLMDSIYQDHRVVSDRTIDSHVKKLRKKLDELGEIDWIQSVYGVGYRYEIPENTD